MYSRIIHTMYNHLLLCLLHLSLFLYMVSVLGRGEELKQQVEASRDPKTLVRGSEDQFLLSFELLGA